MSHTRLSDDVLLADYEFALDNLGNRLQGIEAMEYPGDSEVAALRPTMAEAIVEAITGDRAPGLSAPVMTGTMALPDSLTSLGVQQRDTTLAQYDTRFEVAPNGLTPVVKVKTGSVAPIYEKYVLSTLGIELLKT